MGLSVRVIDQFGQVIDVQVSEIRDLMTSRRFFTRALEQACPNEVTTDRAAGIKTPRRPHRPSARAGQRLPDARREDRPNKITLTIVSTDSGDCVDPFR
jgi:transposase-like protein